MLKVSLLRSSLRPEKTLLLVAILTVTVDQLTKLWLRHSLALGESIPEEGFLRLTHSTNSGIIFGIDVPQVVPLILPLLVIAVAIFLSRRYALFNSVALQTSMGLFLGGSLGNLIDRVRFDYVTDFIVIHVWGSFDWPTFNLADLAIVVGIALLAFSRVRLMTSPKQL